MGGCDLQVHWWGRKMMKSWAYLLSFQIGVLGTVSGLARTGHAQNIVTFDPPSSVDTHPEAIDSFGRITGFYVDASVRYHGFIRSPFGAIATFDAPGGADSVVPIYPVAINDAGQIAGSIVYTVGVNVFHARGFLRAENGVLTEFDATADAVETRPQAINAQGWIGGIYFDASNARHGFLRSPRGTITTFGDLGSIAGVLQVRPNRGVIGYYLQPGGVVFHGFVQTPSGAFSAFDEPQVSLDTYGIYYKLFTGTLPTAASSSGYVVGYFGAAGNAIRGFMRTPEGVFSTLDVPGTWTTPSAINAAGTVAGTYYDATVSRRGFLIPHNGAIESFDPPTSNFGVSGIAADGTVIGEYYDSSGTIGHGFIRKPRASCAHFHF